MGFAFLEPWHLFLPREAGHVVSIAGSGGKTTLLREVALLLAAEGLPVVATTTTRTAPVAGFRPVGPDTGERSGPAAPAGEAAVPAAPAFLHAGVRGDGKWQGLPAEDVDGLEGLVVAEVDGAAGLPFKYYRDGEPVWPSRTSLALVVMGVGGIGERAGAVVHRHGRADVVDPVGTGPDEIWQWDHALALLTGPGGYLDQVPDGVPVALVLAGVEQQPDSIGLFEFTGRAMEHPRVPLVVFCSRGEDGLVLRATFRDEAAGAEADGAADEPAGDVGG